MIITTDSAKPPTARPPAGTRWVCWGYRPATGLPKGPDGHLLIVWQWKAVPKSAPKHLLPTAAETPLPQSLSPRQRRAALLSEQPADLFGKSPQARRQRTK